jgi:hypothetical protein
MRHFYFALTGKQLKTFDEGYNPATGQNFNKLDPDQEYEYDDDNSPNAYIGGLIIAVKFIDHTHFLMFTKEYGFYTMPQGFEYAALYSLSGSKAIKYLPLLSQQQKSAQTYATYPETQSFVRDQATDTSPSAHVLVMAMSEKNGILVYHYAPKTQTLKQVWAPVIAPTHWWHFW